MTEHQMKNIGTGNDPDAPLNYVAELRIPEYSGTFKAHLAATSEVEARITLGMAYPEATIEGLRVL